MTDPRLLEIWDIAETNLNDARQHLTESIGREATEMYLLEQFDKYMSHNELGLALEEIAWIARDFDCNAAFWERLEAAAEVMELADLAAQYKANFLAKVHRG